MDITDTIAPKSDQQNFDDYATTGPRTVTVSGVQLPGGDQPVHIELAEYPGRPFKPNKSMRRVLVKAWGGASITYVGRRLTLFGNPDVTYGGKALGGVEISHMSHIDKPVSTLLTVKRGQKKNFTVQPLKEAAPTPARDLTTYTTDELRALYMDEQHAGATPDRLAAIQAAAKTKEQV